MYAHQRDFLQLAVDHQVLKFGEFTLKSGRVSPYFFNLGQISSGGAMARLARAYAAALEQSGVAYDQLFGPAYKGIPLATAVALALNASGKDIPYAYNRKEKKDHGEGGTLVGAPLRGRVVLVDDVLTAGTALREAITLVRQAGGEPVAALIALDRMERGQGSLTAVQELERDSGIKVIPLVTVQEILGFVRDSGTAFAPGTAEAIAAYQARYGAGSGAA